MSLRNLLIDIGFQFDDSQLEQANAQTDEFRNSFEEMGGDVQEVGDIYNNSFNDMTSSTSDLTDAAQETNSAADELGDTTSENADEAGGAISNLSDSFSSLGTVATGVIGAIGTGLTSIVLKSAQELQTGRARLAWYAAESEGDLEKIQAAIEKTTELSKGFFPEGTLLEATNRAMELGLSMDYLAEHMESIAVLAVKNDKNIDQMMREVGRAVEMGSVRQLMEMGVVGEEHFNMIGKEMSRSIYTWKKWEREQLVAAGLQDVLNKEMDSFDDITETAGYQLGILKQEIGNIQEIAGYPLLKPMANSVRVLHNVLKDMQDSKIGKWVLGLFGYFTLLVGVLAVAKIGVSSLSFALGPLATMLGINTLSVSGLSAAFMNGTVMANLYSIATGLVTKITLAATAATNAFTATLGLLFSPVTLVVIGLIALVAVVQDVITYIQGGDSVLGRFEERFGKIGKVVIRAILPIISMIEVLYDFYEILKDVGSYLGFGGEDKNINANVTETKQYEDLSEDNANLNEARQYEDLSEGNVLDELPMSVNNASNSSSNNFNASVNINVDGNGDANKIAREVDIALRRNFDTLMDDYNRTLARRV